MLARHPRQRLRSRARVDCKGRAANPHPPFSS